MKERRYFSRLGRVESSPPDSLGRDINQVEQEWPATYSSTTAERAFTSSPV